MSHSYDRAATHGVYKGLVSEYLVVGVQRGRRLIQDERGRFVEENAGDSDPLLLTSASVGLPATPSVPQNGPMNDTTDAGSVPEAHK